MFSICSLGVSPENHFANVASAQEQTGKGASLWAARADAVPAPDASEAGSKGTGVRMQTGEVEAKAPCDVGLKDSLRRACCVARTLGGSAKTLAGPFF
jgi:hypothetical protein